MIYIHSSARRCEKDHRVNNRRPVRTDERAYSLVADRCPRA